MLIGIVVLALALGAATSQADAPRPLDSLAPVPEGGLVDQLGEQLEHALEAPGDGHGHGDCPRPLSELGACKPAPEHGHEPQGDFDPYAGGAAKEGHRHAHSTRHDHDHAADPAGPARARGGTAGRTTLEQTIVGMGDPDEGFQFLELGPGEDRIVREELAGAHDGRASRRQSLLYLGQTTDWQLADEESPARVEFLDVTANDPFPDPLNAAWRPQEALGAFAVDRSIRQLNAFVAESPVAQAGDERAPMEMVLMTGDQADNQQLNETEWVLRLLEGGTIDPNSGTNPSACPVGQAPSGQTANPRLYAGVQDYDDYVEGLQFYDPDVPAGPYSDWPRYPGLMDRAQVPFEAAGLDAPTYVVFGNHDGLAQGNEKALLPFEQVGVGCIKAALPVADVTGLGDVLDPGYLAGLLQTDPAQVMLVPPDRARQYVDKAQYKQVFLDGAQADGYGFRFVDQAELAASNGAASYYAWTPKPGIRMIGLDTLCEGGVVGPAANGNVDDPQFRWLERELQLASDRDELIIVFGHHPIGSLSCGIPDETPPPCTIEGEFGHDINAGCDLDPRSSSPVHDDADLTALFHRFPHVIAYVAGHTHENRVGEFDRPRGGPGDFWGIETASLVDWPPQNRLIELMDNCDGTLSIFATTIDSEAPATAPASGTAAGALDGAGLASISRTLAFNDPQLGAGTGEGEAADRNVELLLEDPRRDPATCPRDRGEPIADRAPDRRDDGGPSAPAMKPTTSAGALPFTGLAVGALLLAGVGLFAGGAISRRLAGRRLATRRR